MGGTGFMNHVVVSHWYVGDEGGREVSKEEVFMHVPNAGSNARALSLHFCRRASHELEWRSGKHW